MLALPGVAPAGAAVNFNSFSDMEAEASIPAVGTPLLPPAPTAGISACNLDAASEAAFVSPPCAAADEVVACPPVAPTPNFEAAAAASDAAAPAAPALVAADTGFVVFVAAAPAAPAAAFNGAAAAAPSFW